MIRRHPVAFSDANAFEHAECSAMDDGVAMETHGRIGCCSGTGERRPFMTLQSVCGVTVFALALGAVSVVPAHAQRRDGALLPPGERGDITAVGCLVRGETIRGGQRGKLLLAHPQTPVPSVTEATCTADPGADAITLDDPDKGGLSDLMVGRWVEVSGSLEKETSSNPDNLRELDVKGGRIVPVIPPAPAAARRSPPPAPSMPTPPSQPQLQASIDPIAEPAQLPKTASSRPLVALAGMVFVSAGLLLRSRRRRQRA
jgi:LPXTG-motif cell wall-anchored protein